MRPDDHRRKWDKKEYERKALDRIQKIGTDDGKILFFFYFCKHCNILLFKPCRKLANSSRRENTKLI